MGNNHAHHHPSLSGRRLFISILLNLLISVAQVIGGLLSGSLALLSDAVHNISDVLSLIISYVANRLHRRTRQTTTKTFGYKRAEIIAAFINASTLVVVAVYLGIEAIKRLYHPQEIISDVVIYLAILGALANGISVLLLKSDAEKNMNIKSAYLHLVTDMLTSVAVLFGGLMMKFYAIFWIDALLTLLISIYLIYLSWDILISALKVLMLFSPSHLNIIDIEKEILQVEGIKNIHHVHLWQLNDHDCHFEAHIQFKQDIRLSEFDQKCQQVERILKEKFHISHSNLQPEFFRDDHKEIIIQD